MGGQRSAKPECRALRELVRHLDLEDAVTLEGAVNEDEEYIDPTEFFTYWRAECAKKGVGKGVTSRTWDRTAVECVHSIKKIQRQERRRRKKAKHRANAQNRAHLLTRRDLLRHTEEDVREEHEIRLGQKLERTIEQIRWN
ncbi:uncharacterized protein PITG_05231 [Phytophthora infestans T30-4]|uniref:Uncharacterized protein n=1 Tax=Phytophthora infestans (strain T30-4) TaxID=403677 RepID=D0N3V1_PHYIT|nr:uncharacterized protein PITG_05231 [Phytophthora infestans T30-4]EEY69055.1 hypothetical protein PITG_05231 [Phytophthora infestans T30-4]|eukprot:XP_002998909.1 hypothetical protein PITG_05231 [Phytophthora infestans T30-4]